MAIGFEKSWMREVTFRGSNVGTFNCLVLIRHFLFVLVSLSKKPKVMPKRRTDRREEVRTAAQEGITFPARQWWNGWSDSGKIYLRWLVKIKWILLRVN